VLERARARGVVTALDTGWPPEGWSAEVRAELRATLAHVDLFLPNLDEARGLLDLPDADPFSALLALGPIVAGRTALKLGAAGAAALDGAGELIAASAPAGVVMDTVGAGDTFNAVLLAALRDRLPLPRALRLAVEVTSAALASSPRRLPAWDTLLRRERVAGQPGGRSQRS
jgi:sugar/nucleoside kinase (ribokinase family)